jgi:hypothetical protein
MKTTYFHNSTLNKHGVDVTTDKGDTFGIACPDEQTARTMAATTATLYHLKVVVEMLGPEWFDQSEVQKAIEHIQTIEPDYKP